MLAALVATTPTTGCQRAERPGEEKLGTTVRRGLLVAHALGSIGGMAYTNSLEAMRCNHRRGFRWFEVDLTLTDDEELIAFHTGHENHARLRRPVAELPYSDVQRTRYRGRYPIVRFADVLEEGRSLGDVVLVTDTKSWSPGMLDAVERVVSSAAPRGGPRIVLQAYHEKHIDAVAQLAKKLGGGVILTLYKTSASDIEVAELAKRHGVVAVVASRRRFTPWLAERLHAAQVPILVHTVNEHEPMVELARAGADGFYTDTYVPFERMTADRQALLDCGATRPSVGQLRAWLERALANPDDYRSSACAERREGRVELGGCGSEPALDARALTVPPGGEVRVELEVEAPPQGSVFWFQLVAKGSKGRQREEIRLGPGERRRLTWNLPLPEGSQEVATRLGMSSTDARLSVLRLETTLTPPPALGEPGPPPASGESPPALGEPGPPPASGESPPALGEPGPPPASGEPGPPPALGEPGPPPASGESPPASGEPGPAPRG